MNRQRLSSVDPRLWLICVLGAITVGFCLYKAIESSALHVSPTDRPAEAFAPLSVQLITSDSTLGGPRLNDDIYQALSDRAALLARKALSGRISRADLRRQGMSSAHAGATAALFAQAASTYRRLQRVGGTGFTLQALSGDEADFTGSLQLANLARGSTPLNLTISASFVSNDGFHHASLSSLTFSQD